MLILGAKRSGLPSGPNLTGSGFLVSVPRMVCPTLWAETRVAVAMTATAVNTVRIGNIADAHGRMDSRRGTVARSTKRLVHLKVSRPHCVRVQGGPNEFDTGNSRSIVDEGDFRKFAKCFRLSPISNPVETPRAARLRARPNDPNERRIREEREEERRRLTPRVRHFALGSVVRWGL